MIFLIAQISIIVPFLVSGLFGCIGRMNQEEFEKEIEALGELIKNGIGVIKK